MRIDTATTLYATQRPAATAGQPESKASFAAMPNDKTNQPVNTGPNAARDTDKPDFTSMTRQQLADWMNEQLSAGKMTLDESSAFLGMTISIPVDGSKGPDMRADTTRFDFISKARLGIDGALSHNDPKLAARLEKAISIMQRTQNAGSGINTRA